MECNHSLIADVALVASGRVLLLRYSDLEKYDGEGGWFLPDDALRTLEHPTRAATRIMREQVGVDLEDIRLDHVESFRGNDGSWHLSFHHAAGLPSVPDLRPASGVADARWFPLDALPAREDVAHHGWALSVVKKMNLSAVG
jgi:ADP-ribose pyrophosphatase YjhB (NUDIX family)